MSTKLNILTGNRILSVKPFPTTQNLSQESISEMWKRRNETSHFYKTKHSHTHTNPSRKTLPPVLENSVTKFLPFLCY